MPLTPLHLAASVHRSLGSLLPGASQQGSGSGCPFHFGAAAAGDDVAPPEHLALPPTAPSSSRPATGGGCPFGFGRSREASVAAAPSSRPATGGSGGACPINLNTAEVLASLTFPPTSRFALDKVGRAPPACCLPPSSPAVACLTPP